MKKILPVSLFVPIKYIMRFYVPLMISFLKPDEVEPWFYSSFIQRKVKRFNLNFWMVYKNKNPFVNKKLIPFFSFIKSKKMLLHIIKKLIDKEYYILLDIDWYYLKEYNNYKNMHFNHSILIYGYDFSANVIYTCGYGFDEKITSKIIAIDDLIDAIRFCKNNKVEIYKRKNNVKRDVNLKFLYYGVKGYANSKCPLRYQFIAKSFSLPFLEYYGLSARKQLNTNLKILISGIKGPEEINLTGRIYAYCELTECMIKRLEYLKSKNIMKKDDVEDIIVGFKELLSDYRIMLNMFLKYEQNRNSNIEFVGAIPLEIMEQVDKAIKISLALD